jgi:hypothetical protein
MSFFPLGSKWPFLTPYNRIVSFWSNANWSDQNCLLTTREVAQGGKTFDILCLFCRSYELICAWKGWLYVSLWKLLFVFLYHWHFGGLWTTFLQIIMLKFNAMNFHHLFYKTSYFPSYDSTSILKLCLSPSFWCMNHYPNFNCLCVIHSYSTACVTKMIRSTSNAFHFMIRSKAALCYNQKLYCDSIKMEQLPFPNAYLSIQNF